MVCLEVNGGESKGNKRVKPVRRTTQLANWSISLFEDTPDSNDVADEFNAASK